MIIKNPDCCNLPSSGKKSKLIIININYLHFNLIDLNLYDQAVKLSTNFPDMFAATNANGF